MTRENEVRIAAPITCRLLAEPPGKEAKPGDMWLCPWLLNEAGQPYEGEDDLSKQYLTETIKTRAPLAVHLPGGGVWVVDNISSQDRAQGNRCGWRVTGEAPKITAHPSIQTHNWHGYLRDGVLIQA